jgi:aspartate/tyrosine/aromatic aminotransferase
MAPPDPILGLTEKFKADPRPEKINLGVGVFKDASGSTPVLASVKRAEALLLERERSKNYLEISGSPEFGTHVGRLIFGADSPLLRDGLAQTAQTPGGTGALRVACELAKKLNPKARAWMSDPTWANHGNVFRAAGLETQTYPYYDFASKTLAFQRMREALAAVPAGDLVLFHACCHNPSGMDPTPEQWRELAELAARRGFLPLFDCAYQGFGQGLDPDAASIRAFARTGMEFLVASSYSKNFGLYNERVGGLTVVAASPEAGARAFSHVKALIRANYSNPPFHGAAIVNVILDNPELTALWKTELTAMCARINDMRRQFAEGMARTGCPTDFSFITRQLGMFSFLGLTRDQVLALRDRHALYLIESSRINVAGMTPSNLERICRAIADVMA